MEKGNKFIKSKEYDDKLRCHRARSYVQVLNKENLITEKRHTDLGGSWTHDHVTFFGNPPLYVLIYKHSTHPSPGTMWVDKYEEEKAEVIWEQSDTQDYFQELPSGLKKFEKQIFDWVQKYQSDLWRRNIQLGVISEDEESDNRVILNLTQHPATSEQKSAGVLDMENKERLNALLTFTELPTKEEVRERAEKIAELALAEGAGAAMI